MDLCASVSVLSSLVLCPRKSVTLSQFPVESSIIFPSRSCLTVANQSERASGMGLLCWLLCQGQRAANELVSLLLGSREEALLPSVKTASLQLGMIKMWGVS